MHKWDYTTKCYGSGKGGLMAVLFSEAQTEIP